MEVLITGGCGFIGSHTAEFFLEKNSDVKIVDNLCEGKLSNIANIKRDVEFTKGSILNCKLLERLCKGVDVVVHLAALRSVPASWETPEAYHRANIDGTLNVLNAALKHNCRVVFASSSSVYGNQEKLPKVEEMYPKPISPYAITKLAGEAYCNAFFEEYGLETIALRYFNVYGPRQSLTTNYASVVPAFVVGMLKNKTPKIFGSGKQSRDFTFVKDVANANYKAAKAKKKAIGEVFNIGSGKRVSIIKLYNMIAEQLKFRKKPRFEKPRKGDVMHTLASIKKAEKLLKWKPKYSLGEGLKETIEWFKSKHI
ncbi:MAG: NAD-dependent epimerase/dehydratase family protein [Candidatus Diapherotrites archaeon]|nr:NAD-dependent epimerase/dehydratase family protein [Candidatus Diapherotrites archaeon]